jgi:hypothetical protein
MGSVGSDQLVGGKGDDTYLPGRNFGFDTITENDSISGNIDTAQFLSGVTANQLWFYRPTTTNNLTIDIIGTNGHFVIMD